MNDVVRMATKKRSREVLLLPVTSIWKFNLTADSALVYPQFRPSARSV